MYNGCFLYNFNLLVFMIINCQRRSPKSISKETPINFGFLLYYATSYKCTKFCLYYLSPNSWGTCAMHKQISQHASRLYFSFVDHSNSNIYLYTNFYLFINLLDDNCLGLHELYSIKLGTNLKIIIVHN